MIRRTANEWSAALIRTDNYTDIKKAELIQLNRPKDGWQVFWSRIVDKGVLDLPDASELDCPSRSFDALNHVVEINFNSAYRTYHYSNGK